MGNRGPAKKPTALKLLQGEHRASRINANEPVPRPLPPEPPGWLPKDVRAVWDRTLVELTAMNLAASADGDSLVVFCQAVVHYAEACRLVNTAGILIKGENGGVVKNPAMQIVRDTGHTIRTMGGQFGLTPAARAGLSAGRADDAESPFGVSTTG